MNTDMKTKRKMRPEEASSYLGIAKATLAKWRVMGCSPPYVKVGRCVLYDLAEIEAWLSANRRRSTSG